MAPTLESLYQSTLTPLYHVGEVIWHEGLYWEVTNVSWEKDWLYLIRRQDIHGILLEWALPQRRINVDFAG